MKKILIISHDATRTGAPILLLNLVQAIQAGKQFNVTFLLKGEGALFQTFCSAAPVIQAYKKSPVKNILKKIPYVRRFVTAAFSEANIRQALKEVDIVLSNTITNGDLLPYIKKNFGGPIFSYIHELEMAAAHFTNPADVHSLMSCTDRFFVPSKAVENFIARQYHITGGKIDILNYFIPAGIITESKSGSISTERKVSFVVGGAGTIDWRKGPELFIAIARLVRELQPDASIQFTWKGAQENSTALERLQYDLARAGLTESVYFLPLSAEMDAFYHGLDLFLLTSREDPYPLVILEAAGVSVPSICFTEAGGATEFIQNDAGRSVPYLDIHAAATAVLYYYNNTAARKQHGRQAKKRLLEYHQNPALINQQLNTAFAKVLAPAIELTF